MSPYFLIKWPSVMYSWNAKIQKHMLLPAKFCINVSFTVKSFNSFSPFTGRLVESQFQR